MIATGLSRIHNTVATGVNVTAGSPAHTKGAWAQLVAATSHEAHGVYVGIPQTGINQSLFDLGIGGAGSEKVLVPNMLLVRAGLGLYLPVSVPAGVRLAMRSQANFAATVRAVQVKLLAGGFGQLLGMPSSRVTDYGVNLAATRGVLLQTSTNNTKTAWVELTASTTAPIRYLVVFHSPIESNGFYRVDIGVGGAGSEKVLLPDIVVNGASGGSVYCGPPHSIWPVYIPAGSRLACRYQVNDHFFSTRDDFTVSVLGVG